MFGNRYEYYSLDQLLELVRNGRIDVSKKAGDEIRKRLKSAQQKMHPTDGTHRVESALSQPETNPVSEVDTTPTIGG